MRTFAKAATLLLVATLTTPAGAADNVTCTGTVHGANVVPARTVPGVVTTYGTDMAVATAICLSATGQQYDATVYVAIFDSNMTVIAAADGTPAAARAGVAVTSVTARAAGYEPRDATATPRIHAAWAWIHTSDCQWPCVKATVSTTYPA